MTILGWILSRLQKENNRIYYIGGSDILPPPLRGEEEKLAIDALNRGEESARQTLVEHNLRLVVYIARRFENSGTNLEDLISIGTIGLMKAIGTYRSDRNIKLATYASRCIENEILMYFRKIANQKTEISLDEPINLDGEGNELLLSDVLGTAEDEIQRPLEADAEVQVLRKALTELPVRGGRAEGADPEGSGPEAGDFPILYFPAGKADSWKTKEGIPPADQLRVIRGCNRLPLVV